ncbi:MAG: tetrahydromethanopterin S-methyltransferase subunit F [Methanoregulaceae archaeon]|jgi:tetrahydromethanopterin S-methyltransferase subunit F|nr:tetrahydromethanopterin S-methyltransferase subunit F [Methanoregulaceae archaeon]
MAEEGAKMAGPVRMVAIDRMVENVRYKAQLIARSNKFDSAISEMGVIGFAVGLFVALILIVVPALFI